MQPPALRIRETVTHACGDRSDAVLHAWLDGELIAALDFTLAAGMLRINLVFVKPQFRRRGIAAALLRHLRALYPDLPCSSAPRPWRRAGKHRKPELTSLAAPQTSSGTG
jgi:GNAT superfamily N-acetyltransferase